MSSTPVVMVGYSRSATLRHSLYRLSKCDGVGDRPIFLYLDAPYKVEHQSECADMYKTACEIRDASLRNLTIVKRDHNYGVPGNLIDAVSVSLDRFGRIIFFEDDVLVSKFMLRYMDAALDLYENDKRIFCVNAFHHPFLRVSRFYKNDVFLSLRNTAWGFGMWKDRWDAVDFSLRDWEGEAGCPFRQELNRAGCDIARMLDSQKNGRIHTWDIQCSYHMVKNRLFAIEPRYSMTKNIGFGVNGGVHCKLAPTELQKMAYYNFTPRLPSNLSFDPIMENSFRYVLQDFRLWHRVGRRLYRETRKFIPNTLEPKDI